MRRKTFGSDMIMLSAQLSLGGGIPAGIFASRPMQGLAKSAQDYACLANDIFSYQKEIEFEGEFHNCVLVVQRFTSWEPSSRPCSMNSAWTKRLVNSPPLRLESMS